MLPDTGDNGALQVEAMTTVPLVVFLAGPIKHWWGADLDGMPTWGSAAHRRYMSWRDSVREASVRTGKIVVYSPHRAIQGLWHSKLQTINNAAILTSDVMLALTPEGTPAKGTQEEMNLARLAGVDVWHAPPGTADDLRVLIDALLWYRSNRQTVKSLSYVG